MTEWLTQSPEDFLSSAPPSMNGNSPWAQRYAAEIRRAWYAHAAQDARTLQTHLGPSELGVECLTGGCLVRRACPLSQSYARLPEQSAYHMGQFHR